MLDLSYFDARNELDARVAKAQQRRENLRTSVTAPLACVGLAVGTAVTYWLYITLPVLHVAMFAIPWGVAAAFYAVPSRMLESRWAHRQRALELSLGDLEALELIDQQRRIRGEGVVQATHPNPVF